MDIAAVLLDVEVARDCIDFALCVKNFVVGVVVRVLHEMRNEGGVALWVGCGDVGESRVLLKSAVPVVIGIHGVLLFVVILTEVRLFVKFFVFSANFCEFLRIFRDFNLTLR